jgi:hypothetical protein
MAIDAYLNLITCIYESGWLHSSLEAISNRSVRLGMEHLSGVPQRSFRLRSWWA